MNENHGNPQQEAEVKRQIAVSQILPFVAIGVFILLCAYYFHQLVKNKWGIDQEKLGQFGDFVGGILNPLVAMFALIAVVVSVGLQKTVLDETRKELKVTQKIAIDQATTADQQRREQRFFDLLNLYQRTVDSLTHTQRSNSFFSSVSSSKHPPTTNIFHGKAAIDEWLSGSLLQNFCRYGFGEKEGSQYSAVANLDHLHETWQEPEIGNFIDQYFRVIYRILSEAETLLGADHYRYVKLLRAQLNRNELTLLAFNMWLDEEGVEMKPLADKYGLLKHLPKNKLRDEVETIFPLGIFGNGFKLTKNQHLS